MSLRSLSVLPFGYGPLSKLTLLMAMVQIKLGIAKPFTCKLTIDGSSFVTVHFAGTRDELTIVSDLFIAGEYAAAPDAKVEKILDLGANIGLASAWLRLTYPTALIHAYEPAPHAFALLKKNATNIGNMQVFAEAIGANSGSVTFHESDRSVASSVIKSSALESSRSITVPMVTIDTALERIGGADLMKVDIEGAEFDALAAATQLQKATYITGEAHPAAAKRSLAEIPAALSKTHTVTIRHGDRLAAFYAVVK